MAMVRFPTTPRTPQAMYVSERIGKFGQFLSLSDHARSRAILHQKKQKEANSARTMRRRSIFDSVKSVLLDSSDEIPNLTQSTSSESSPEVQEKKSVSSHDRYKRRGSCTKFSLEAELKQGILDSNDDDDEDQFKFKSFRRNESLQSDDVFSDAYESDYSYRSRRANPAPRRPSTTSNSSSPQKPFRKELMTIDQMPVPMRGSFSKEESATQGRTLLDQPLPPVHALPRRLSSSAHARPFPPSSPVARDSDRLVPNVPQSCKADTRGSDSSKLRSRLPILRHISNSSPRSSSLGSKKGRSKHHSSGSPNSMKSSNHKKQTILPPAPFVHDSDVQRASGYNHGLRASSGRTTEIPLQSDKRRESAPTFGSLLRRLHLQRSDSVKSFAEDSANEDGSMTESPSQQDGSRRVPRRASISTKTYSGNTSSSPENKKEPGWHRQSRSGVKSRRDSSGHGSSSRY